MPWPKGQPQALETIKKRIATLKAKRPTGDNPIREGSVIHLDTRQLALIYGKRRDVVEVTCGGCGFRRRICWDSARKKEFNGLCLTCNGKKLRGAKHPKWTGGLWIQSNGYIGILVQPGEPFAEMRDVRGYVYEHRLVMARHLNRALTRSEHVHHLNGIKDDNRIENLTLVNGSTHLLITKLEARIRELEAKLAEHA